MVIFLFFKSNMFQHNKPRNISVELRVFTCSMMLKTKKSNANAVQSDMIYEKDVYATLVLLVTYSLI